MKSPFEGFLSKSAAKALEILQRDWQWISKLRVKVDWQPGPKLFDTYMELIAEAEDPKLLDRAVPSFSYMAWLKFGGESTDLLARAYNRLMAADTSVCVRETVKAQMRRFAQGLQHPPWSVDRLDEQRLKQLSDFISDYCSFPADLPTYTTIVSFHPDNEDLRYIGELSVDGCVAQLLCAYDRYRKAGEREDIFHEAARWCNSLIRLEKIDEVRQILQHANPTTILRSFMQAPKTSFVFVRKLISVLTSDHYNVYDTLLCVTEFLKFPPYNINHDIVSLVIYYLIGFSHPFPTDFDISPIIAHVAAHPNLIWWKKISDAIVVYLQNYQVSQLSDPTAAFRFLQLCVDPAACDEGGHILNTPGDVRQRAQAILDMDFLPTMVPLPSVSSSSSSVSVALPPVLEFAPPVRIDME
ncbi:hypothetical protein SISSUDRAFT_405118 [Sistotremastrum suecicum HHB10207 ss-3]|uniref:Uncharacterized protein n=1 Tax=Sistotremastrum suecicum HHB10207 ss-3 TaxID=1314776 RepID=A0A165YS53_9AGAM|nr:hypothetical protein SISSUDRAFT_405118 [Sistotremastrum suecicum HHB10207 ss-3]